MPLIAVNYHYVRPSFKAAYPAVFGLTLEEFEAQLRLLGRAGQFLGAREVSRALDGRGMPDKSILVTFDDGLREQAEFAWPVLRRLGIPALFFVNSAPILHGTVETVHKVHLMRSVVAPPDFLALVNRVGCDRGIDTSLTAPIQRVCGQYPYDDAETARIKYLLNCVLGMEQREQLVAGCFESVFPGQEAELSHRLYLSADQVRALGEAVGSHSHHHMPLGLVSREEAARDLEHSAKYLTEWLGQAPFAVSYPYGSRETCPRWVEGVAAGAGFRVGFTMERARNRDFRHPLRLARMDSCDVPGGRNSRFTAEELFTAVPEASWSQEEEHMGR
jgi:peptidoglycan/xylan/chitin deacetylase (PgdA/CDA1 family)